MNQKRFGVFYYNNADENKHSSWINVVSAGEKSKDAKCMMLFKNKK